MIPAGKYGLKLIVPAGSSQGNAVVTNMVNFAVGFLSNMAPVRVVKRYNTNS